MRTTLRSGLAAFAIVGVAGVEALGQRMTAPAALTEFGLPGHWAAPSCDRPFVVLTFESSPTAQFVVRSDKDGVRFGIASATKLEKDLATLELRRTAMFQDGMWQATSAADAGQVLTYAFGKSGNNLASTWESQLRLGVPAGVYMKCATLGPFDSAPRGAPLPPPPPPPRR
jgi:hypothetical protein